MYSKALVRAVTVGFFACRSITYYLEVGSYSTAQYMCCIRGTYVAVACTFVARDALRFDHARSPESRRHYYFPSPAGWPTRTTSALELSAAGTQSRTPPLSGDSHSFSTIYPRFLCNTRPPLCLSHWISRQMAPRSRIHRTPTTPSKWKSRATWRMNGVYQHYSPSSLLDAACYSSGRILLSRRCTLGCQSPNS